MKWVELADNKFYNLDPVVLQGRRVHCNYSILKLHVLKLYYILFIQVFIKMVTLTLIISPIWTASYSSNPLPEKSRKKNNTRYCVYREKSDGSVSKELLRGSKEFFKRGS